MPNYKGRTPGTRRVILSVKGKPREWTVPGTKADGDRFEAAKLLELSKTKLSTRVPPVFTDYCTHRYEPFARVRLKARAWERYVQYTVKRLCLAFANLTTIEIDDAKAEEYQNDRLAVGAKPGTINRDCRVLLAILRHAKKNGYPTEIPKIAELTVREKPRVKFWTEPQVLRLIAAASKLERELEAERWWSDLIIFLLNSGCRRMEALAFEWDWVDFDAGMLRIPSNVAWQPKDGEPREVPLSDSLRAVLANRKRTSHLIFPNRYGTRHINFPGEAFKLLVKAAGLTGTPHMLRHTFASLFLAAPGTNLFLLAEVLGHSTTRVTLAYSHMLPTHLAKARNAVNIGGGLKVVGSKVS